MTMSSLIEIDPVVVFPSTMTDRIYAALKHRILTCGFLPGARIVEKEICAEMNTSRTPLREALNRLSHEGLVVLNNHRGYAVSPVTVDDFQDLCELRRIVEPAAAAVAAERASSEDIDRLVQASELRYTRGDSSTYEGYLRANSAFHLALVQCTNNKRLQAIIMSALDQHQRPLYLGLNKGINAEESTHEHLDVIDAIKTKNSERARSLMYNHISRGEERIIKALVAAGY